MLLLLLVDEPSLAKAIYNAQLYMMSYLLSCTAFQYREELKERMTAPRTLYVYLAL